MSTFVIELDELLTATGGRLLSGGPTRFAGASIDGRSVVANEIYFAIQGENFDGHDYCAQAVAAGATALVVSSELSPPTGVVARSELSPPTGVVVSSELLPPPGVVARSELSPPPGVVARSELSPPPGVSVVLVDDTRVALGQLARAVRRRSGAKVIAITGSSGKTTTKDLVYAMLAGVASADTVLASVGSLNNETGVPLTLLRLRAHHRFAVVEMGMRGLGQIDYLARLAEPDVGVVTNAGSTHVGVVGTVADIARGKSEVWAHLAVGGAVVMPHGDPRLQSWVKQRAPAHKVATFGEKGADVFLQDVRARGILGSDVTVNLAGRVLRFRLPLVGRHNASNAACALAIAVALDVDIDDAIRGLSHATAPKQRSEIVAVRERHVLVDCYNASPSSMRAAIDTLRDLRSETGSDAVAIVGDMLERGDLADDEHRAIGDYLVAAQVDKVIGLGPLGSIMAKQAKKKGARHTLCTDDPVEAAQTALGWSRPGDWFLLKASRAMRLERVLEAMSQEAKT